MELKLTIPIKNVYGTNQVTQTLGISRDSDIADEIYITFGDFEAVIDKNELKRHLLPILD